MAYADSISRSRSGAPHPRASEMGSPEMSHSRSYVEPSTMTEPEGTSSDRGDLARAGLLGGALAIGVLIGAGAALLLATQTGEDMRAELADGTRRLQHRAGDAWDDLRDELRWAARRGSKHVRRSVTRGGWAAEDAIDHGRRRVRF